MPLPTIHSKTLNLTLAAILAALGLLFSACNTTQGFGEDMETAGKSIQKEAKENK